MTERCFNNVTASSTGLCRVLGRRSTGRMLDNAVMLAAAADRTGVSVTGSCFVIPSRAPFVCAGFAVLYTAGGTFCLVLTVSCAACMRLNGLLAVEADMAKALGQAMALNTDKTVLCIDRVRLQDGDYLDVGAPVGPALPVVVKTLILSR